MENWLCCWSGKKVRNLICPLYNLSQVRQPTAPLWRPWAATCLHPSTSQPPVISSWCAGPQTTAQIREASKFAMLVSTKVCIPTLFHYYSLLLYCMEIRTEVDWDRQKDSDRKLLVSKKEIKERNWFRFNSSFIPYLTSVCLLNGFTLLH